MEKKININNVDEIYNYGLSCLEKVGINISLNDIKSALSIYLEDINNEQDIRNYLGEFYDTFIPEEEVSLTTEEIYSYGFEYCKKKNLNLSYDEVVNILSPHVEYTFTESDVEDRIYGYFEDNYDFVPEDDNSDYGYEFELEEEVEYFLEEEEEEYKEYEEELEYFM